MTAYNYCRARGLACSTAALTHGCRCDVCALWYTKYKAERREGRPAKLIHAASPKCPVHELAASNAYRVHRCRCGVCKAWNASRERRRKAMNKLRPVADKWIADLREDPIMALEVAAKMMAAYRSEAASRAKAAERRKVKVRRWR